MREIIRETAQIVALVCVGFDGFWFAMRYLNGDAGWLYVPAVGVTIWAWAQIGKSIEREIDREQRQRRD